jgi:transcriptional regulator with XRE-family HTH domain
MSLRTFSHKIGYDSAQVSNWLNGKRFIGNNAREKIQKYMKLDWDTLFEIVDDVEIIRKELQRD